MTSPYATIVDAREFNAPMFAEKIDRALRAGEKDAVVNVITSISNAQRQQLREPYKLKYGKDIIQALDKKFSGDLEKAIFALMETPLDYDVKQLKAAMKGLGTDEAVLIEILCSRTVDQLRAIRVTYEKEYGKALEADIAGDTSGEFRDLLVSLVTGSKDGSHDTNDAQAKDVSFLYFFTVINYSFSYFRMLFACSPTEKPSLPRRTEHTSFTSSPLKINTSSARSSPTSRNSLVALSRKASRRSFPEISRNPTSPLSVPLPTSRSSSLSSSTLP